MPEIRVLLADEHRSFVEALAMRLEGEAGLHVVATASAPDQVPQAVRARPVDVAVLALDGDPDGFLEAGRQAVAIRPGLKQVAVTSDGDVTVLARAVRAGFRAWVTKDVGIHVLIEVLRGVCRGETLIPPTALTGLLRQLLHDQQQARAAQRPLARLTSREHEVLVAMSSGATREEIARRLCISGNTVRTHTQSILTKLGVHTSLAAVSLARQAGAA
jgi:DNA-binding NarL/FixJ family response regulator